jgi:drug/metabolite transporter (DMT)-like permease
MVPEAVKGRGRQSLDVACAGRVGDAHRLVPFPAKTGSFPYPRRALGWLAVINTALAFTLWNRSLQYLTATESAAINNTMLIQIAILAWIFLGEAPGGLDIIGMAAVSVGVYLARRTRAEMSMNR